MPAKLLSAFGYQGDEMNLPVKDIDASVPYYVEKMGFEVVEQDMAPGEPPPSKAVRRVVLERDGIRIALAENGGDQTRTGARFTRMMSPPCRRSSRVADSRTLVISKTRCEKTDQNSKYFSSSLPTGCAFGLVRSNS